MKNKAFYDRVAKKAGTSPELISFIANQMYKTIDSVVKNKQHTNIKIPGFADIKLSLVKVNGVLRHKTVPELRANRQEDWAIEKFKRLWAVRQMLIQHEISYKSKRPKRYVKKK